MKPHLPLLLMAALCAAIPAQANFAPETNTYSGSSNTNITLLSGYTASTLIFDMSGGYFANANQTYAGDIQIGVAGATTTGLVLNDGYQNSSVTFSGAVTGSGTLSKTGSGLDTSIIFAGNVTDFTGNILLGTDNTRAFILQFGGANAVNHSTADAGVSGTGTITFTTNANTLVYNYAAGDDTSSPVYVTNTIVKDGGTSKVTLSGSAAMEFTKSVVIDTLTISNAAASVTFHEGTLGTVSGTAAGLVKTGTGTLAFGDLGGNTLTVNEGSVTGTLTNGTIAAGTGGTLGTAGAGFTLNGGTIDFGNVATTATLGATGTLTFTSGNLRIGNLDTLNTTDTYVLLNGSDLRWGNTDFAGVTINDTIRVGTDGSFYQQINNQWYQGLLSTQETTNSLVLNMQQLTSRSLTWNGGSGTWATGSNGWNITGSTGGTETFSSDDFVTFGSNSTEETITISGNVNPTQILVEQGAYIFTTSDNGQIAGKAELTVGNATSTTQLAINLANADWDGKVFLQEDSTLVLGNTDALGTSTISFNGGTLQYATDITEDISAQITAGTGAVKVDTNGNDITWATDVLANHAIEKSGAGCLTLDSVTLSSNVNINLVEGDLALNVSSNQTSTITADNKLVLSGEGKLVKTGTDTWQIVQESNLSEADSNTMSGNTFAGDILISEGTLLLGRTSTGSIVTSYALSGNALGTDGTIEIASAATLQLAITQNGTVNFTKDVILAGSSTLHTVDGNYNLSGKLTLTGDATIQVDWGKTVNIANLIEGAGKLTLKHGGATERGYLVLGAANAGDTAVTAFSGGIDVVDGNIGVRFTHAQALGSGNVNLTNANNTLEYRGTSGEAYDTMSNVVSGAGGMTVTSGTLEMAGANTFTGATAVAAGASLKVSGSIGSDASSNTYNVAKGAKLVLSGAGAVANSGVTVTTRSNTQATLSDTPSREVVEGELSNVTVTATGIARTSQDEVGTITNGAITVTQTEGFSIQNIELVNSLVDLQSTGSVTLDNVTIGAGTTVNRMEGAGNVTLNNSKLVMTTAQTTVGSLNNDTHTLSVTSTGLAGYTTISGSLTFDLTKEWIDNLVTNAGGNFTTIELTFSDVNADVWNDFKANGSPTLAQTGELNDSMFGPPTVTFGDTAGTVIIAATTNIPEPATATLGLLGLSSLLLRRRRKVQD